MNRIFNSRFLLMFLVSFFLIITKYAYSMADNANDVEVCTWKNCHKGAMSVTIDDTRRTCFSELNRNGFKGTYYVLTRPNPFSFRYFRYAAMLVIKAFGHEIGAHSSNHYCHGLVDQDFNNECLFNDDQINKWIRVQKDSIISMAWPCGKVQNKEIASEYYLSSRGYYNEGFEDSTPEDFMNLKSFSTDVNENSGNYLKELVDEAVLKSKWVLFAFHRKCNDSGAIDYAGTKDIWVAPVGEVVKYIYQRDGVKISEVIAKSDSISFDLSRDEISSSKYKNFEYSFSDDDVITMKVGIDNGVEIESVMVSENISSFKVLKDGDSKYIYFDVNISFDSLSKVFIQFKSL